MTRDLMQRFHRQAWIYRRPDKQRLLAMTPATYVGKAAELARRV